MSFLSDAFEGNWSHLGTDLSHSGSSLMHHPTEMLELGGAAALGAAPFLLPEIGGLFGAGAGAGDILTGGAALGLDPAAAAASGGFETAAAGADTSALGFGTQAIDPLSETAFSGAGGGGANAGFDASAINPATGVDVTTGENPLLGGINANSVTGVPAAGPATPPTPPGGNFMDTLTSPSQWTLPGVGKGLGVAAAGAGLGMNLMRGNQMDPNQQKLQDLAGQLGSQGQVLESYLKTGKLPPALQAQLDQAKQSEKARIISGYAARGQPTDPRMNSALAQEINNVDTNALAAMAQVQINMLNTGLKETGMTMELYQMLTQMDKQQEKELMQSISTFAAALGGGFGGSPRMA
jgi:hypothetical protein